MERSAATDDFVLDGTIDRQQTARRNGRAKCFNLDQAKLTTNLCFFSRHKIFLKTGATITAERLNRDDVNGCIASTLLLSRGRLVSSLRRRLPSPKLHFSYLSHHIKSLDLHVAPRELVLEPVGPHFLAHARRKRHNRTFSEDEKHQAEIHASTLEDRSGNVSEDDEPEDPEMLERDPKEWKVRLFTQSIG
jgi:hypothetical protein